MFDLAKRSLIKTALDSMDTIIAGFFESPTNKWIAELLGKEIGNASVTGESYRIINHWGEKGVIDFSRKENKEGWRVFTLKEIIWLKVVHKLRNLQIGLPFIKVLKDDFWGIDESDRSRRSFDLELYTALSLTRKRVLLVITSQAQCEYVIPEELELYLNNNTFPHNYIAIDIGTIIREHFTIKDKTAERSTLHSMSHKETDVLVDLREAQMEEQGTSITVKVANGEIVHINKKRIVKEYNQEIQAILKRNLPKNYFGTATLVIKNGKLEFVETEDSKLLKD